MKVGTLAAIHRYPVKSMAGETLQEVALGAAGLPGDRAWAVRDEERGGIRGAKKIPQLMELRSRYAKAPAADGSSPAEITLRDGSSVETGASDVNQKLSADLAHPVSLWPLLPADALDHYRRGAPTHTDLEQELRATFGREPDEPLPDLGLFPPELLQFESPPGTYFDAFPLLLLTTRALTTLQERAAGSRIDVRRFRPNFVIADADEQEAMPELGWRGGLLRVGSAAVRVTVECPRCVMVTHGFGDLPKDPKIMRTLVRELGGNLGVYAAVETPGTVSVGDEVTLER